MGKPVDIEVVQNNAMVYTFSVLDLPTPIRLRIQYTDKDMSIKESHLVVTCQFHPFEEKAQDANKNSQKWSKQYPTPSTIVIQTQGDQTRDVSKLLSKRPARPTRGLSPDLGVLSLDIDPKNVSRSDLVAGRQGEGRSASQEGAGEGPSRARRKRDFIERFTENKLYVMFQSHVGCSILVTAEQIESRANVNKRQLRERKAALVKRFEEVHKHFSKEEPYYVEMLNMVDV